jgi:hypothetical protein
LKWWREISLFKCEINIWSEVAYLNWIRSTITFVLSVSADLYDRLQRANEYVTMWDYLIKICRYAKTNRWRNIFHEQISYVLEHMLLINWHMSVDSSLIERWSYVFETSASQLSN